MLIGEVIDAVKAHCRQTVEADSPIDPTFPSDRVLWGGDHLGDECTGVVCCIWASADVVRQAVAQGANLVISHEALLWNHGDRTDWLEETGNRVYRAKRDLLDQAGVVVWRCHDHLHAGIPGPDGTWVDGIFWATARRLGWQPLEGVDPLPAGGLLCRAEVAGPTAQDLALDVMGRLGLAGTRVVGSPETPVRVAGLAMHLNGRVDRGLITALDQGRVDCLLAMETTDYTVLEYVRDACALGRPKAIVCVGHYNLEEPGMEAMAAWLPGVLGPACPPCSFVPAGDPYHYLSLR